MKRWSLGRAVMICYIVSALFVCIDVWFWCRKESMLWIFIGGLCYFFVYYNAVGINIVVF